MNKPSSKPVEPVKAWAVLHDGQSLTSFNVYRRKKYAEEIASNINDVSMDPLARVIPMTTHTAIRQADIERAIRAVFVAKAVFCPAL